MKITSVDIIRSFKEPSIPAEVAVGNVPWHPVFVRVNTDEGISGLGEVGVAYGNAQSAGFGMAVDFAKCIIGLDPMNNEQIWDRLHRLTFWGMGNGGVIMAGISGIDIALWDIRGKAWTPPSGSSWAARPTRGCAPTPPSCSSTGARSLIRLQSRRNMPKRCARPWPTASTP